ncbi:MAG: threonine synthase [Patescibacteria group bacterium]
MQCYSTNRKSPLVSFQDALLQGQPPDRGLFMPAHIPEILANEYEALASLSYPDLAYELSKRWIGDEVAEETLHAVSRDAYAWPVPLMPITDTLSVLELWHGPTLSFKDFAAQWLGRMVHALMKPGATLTVLVATSGDTGSAVAAGFSHLPGIRVVLLYPSGKVSALQEQQLTTYGGNVQALEVMGTFDDCQRMVKEAFADANLRAKITLTSANSINIGRLIPQSFYYVWAYLRMAQTPQTIRNPLVFCVPSGNFGNLTGGLLAARMGIPVAKFIAAANANAVLPELLRTGILNTRPSVHTLSNAMDVGNPSNIARIFDLYTIDKTLPASDRNIDQKKLEKDIWSISIDDRTTLETIQRVYKEHRYVMDPHTAVGWRALELWRETEEGKRFQGHTVLVSTAHPAKFMDVIERVLPSGAVAMPPSLQNALQRPKQATQIPAEYNYLKEILLSR